MGTMSLHPFRIVFLFFCLRLSSVSFEGLSFIVEPFYLFRWRPSLRFARNCCLGRVDAPFRMQLLFCFFSDSAFPVSIDSLIFFFLIFHTRFTLFFYWSGTHWHFTHIKNDFSVFQRPSWENEGAWWPKNAGTSCFVQDNKHHEAPKRSASTFWVKAPWLNWEEKDTTCQMLLRVHWPLKRKLEWIILNDGWAFGKNCWLVFPVICS